MEYVTKERTLNLLFVILLCGVFFPVIDAQADAPPSQNCTNSYEWLCEDQTDCIFKEWRCDGESDCADGSDETRELCDPLPCEDSEYECLENKRLAVYPKCIPKLYLCDGEQDCEDGADEEEDCATTAPACTSEEFACQDQTCIPKERACDHLEDCSEGEDERECVYPTCTAEQFTCRNGYCIDKSKQCDGNWDCRDGSDESEDCNTPRPTCQPGYFSCLNGKCIEYNKRCNSQDDCGDNSDENNDCTRAGQNECRDKATNNCTHICNDMAFGYTCACNSGFALMEDRVSCREINECDEHKGACSQICENNQGSFKCSCANGYKTNANDINKCEKSDNITPYIIYANRFYVRSLYLNGTSPDRISDHHEYTHVLDYDYDSKTIYLADAGKQKIMKMDFDGNNSTIVSAHFTAGVEGICTDFVTKKLYWTSTRQQGLYVSEYNGTNIHVLVSSGTTLPRAIAVHPAKGILLWSDWSLEPFIARIGMDGKNMTKIITDGLFWPNGLTIDYPTDKVFWADAHLDKIFYANIDGTGRHTVTSTVAHPFAITVFEDYLYWSEWNLKRIEKAHKYHGENVTILQETLHQPYDLQVVHPLRQPKIDNPCADNNGGCSHLCLLSMEGNAQKYSCQCPYEFELGADGKTCISTCTVAQFECGRSDHKCIPHTWVCDGESDCKGGEDELDCPAESCDAGQYKCGNTSQCILSYRLCDGTTHCDDGSDENEEICNASQCRPWEFRCNSGQCVLKRFTCDGDDDCGDKSDEAPINHDCGGHGTCNEGEFKCNNNKCIPFLWFCDWDDDCGDASDEPNPDFCYKNTTCRAGWSRCKKNYRCIPTTSLCDGENDCRDNTDEEDCPLCDASEFTCDNEQCIPQRWVCDFEDDCGDNTDEKDETCAGSRPPCSEIEFRCDNEKCIRETFKCDNEDDCGDGSDEKDDLCINTVCPDGRFQCNSGHCIAESLKCDGRKDCRDGSDEGESASCPTKFPGGRYCPTERFECDSGVCILNSWLCDGDNDCGDDSDETPLACKNVTCNASTRFRCGNGKCIARYKTCNQIDDCGDGSDENNITMCGFRGPQGCEFYEYQCRDKECIDLEDVCNGEKNCQDNSDEDVCFRTAGNFSACESNENPCEQKCLAFDGGHFCTCNSSYRLSTTDKTSCIDIDECASWGNNCPQTCTNIKGGYKCSCVAGFKHQANGTICAPPNNGDALNSRELVLYSKGYEIRGMAGNTLFDVVLSGRRINAFDIDVDEKMVYYVDSGLQKIFRALIPNDASSLSYTQDLEIGGLDKTEGIAFDWIGKNIYWTDARRGGIYVAKQEGWYKKTLLRGGGIIPYAIAVAPLLGKLFFTDVKQSQPTIQSMFMDGNRRQTLVDTNLVQPTGITVDYHMGHRVFFVDMRMNRVESINPDGTDRVYITSESAYNPLAVDVFANDLYWTSQMEGRVLKMDKFGRGVNASVQNNQYTLYGIKIYNINKTNTAQRNPCQYMACNMLCLLTPNMNAKCACADGVNFINGSNGVQICDPSAMPKPRPRPKPQMCTCQNGGLCVYISGQLQCQCPLNFTGNNCEVPKVPPTTTTTSTTTTTTTTYAPPRTRPPSRPATPSANPATFPPTRQPPPTRSRRTTTPASTTTHTPSTQVGASTSGPDFVVIIVPIIVILVILVLVVAVIIYVLRSGKLGKRSTGHGEFRPGPAGENQNGHASFNPDAPVVMSSLNDPIQYQDGAFSNPMYEKLSNVGGQAGEDVRNHNAEPLPAKEEISFDA